MFERFTAEARDVLAQAGNLARELRSPFIRRHHMLIAVLDDPSDVTADVLADAEVDPAQLRARLLASLRASEEPDGDAESTKSFTREAKKTLELALREALSLGHNYIADYHLLLGILREMDGPLASVIGETKLSRAQAGNVVSQQAPTRRSGRRARREQSARSPFVIRGPRGRRGSAALQSVLGRAFARAEDRDATTGDLLVALLETPGTHFAAALSTVSLPDAATVAAEVDRLLVAQVPDGTEGAIRVDDATGAVTIKDPQIAAEIKRLVGEGHASPDALREILRRLQQ